MSIYSIFTSLMPHLAQATLYTPLSYALSILILPSEIQNRNEISLILFHFPKSEYIKLIKSLIVFIHNLFSVQKIIEPKILHQHYLTKSQKKNTLMQEYSSTKSTMDELYQVRKNYRIYMCKEMER